MVGKKDCLKKMTGTTGGHFLPLILEFIVLGGS